MKPFNNILLLFSLTLMLLSCGGSESPTSTVEELISLPSQETKKTNPSNEDSSSFDYAEEELAIESGVSKKAPTKSKGITPKNAKPTTIAKKEQNPTSEKQAEEEKEVIKKNPVKAENDKKEGNFFNRNQIDKGESPVVEEPVAEKAPEKEEPVEKEVTFSHEAFDQLLRKYVSSNGKVNYSGFKTAETDLDAYLKMLDENPPADGWSKSKKMAYWINAYNAGTIKLILKNYPVSSITKLHGGKPWDQKWIPLGGKTYSLNNIENDILRPVYKDARIHFAVNCAAKSCPPLLNKAWTESNLNKYLDSQAKVFINDSSQNEISQNAVKISKIFEWYSADFDDIITYLNKYSAIKIKPGAKVSYKEYNWDLNK